MDMESGLIGMICFLNESKKHQTTFVGVFVYRHLGLVVDFNYGMVKIHTASINIFSL